MKPVFLDTVGLIAVWNSHDQWHQSAKAALAQLQADRNPLITTSYVLGECGNAAARRRYRGAVIDLSRRLQRTNGLIMPDTDDWEKACKNYDADVTGAGLVDHLSFVILHRLGIQRVFTNDIHFRRAGFEVLF